MRIGATDGEFWFRPKAFATVRRPHLEGLGGRAVYVPIGAALTLLLMERSEKDFTAWGSWIVAIVVATSVLTLVAWNKIDGRRPYQWRPGQIEKSEKAS